MINPVCCAQSEPRSGTTCDPGETTIRPSIDMTGDPRRHFILRRSGEVSTVGRPSHCARACIWRISCVPPRTSRLRAARMVPELGPTRRRLEAWRQTLGALHQQGVAATSPPVPEGQRVRGRHELGA